MRFTSMVAAMAFAIFGGVAGGSVQAGAPVPDGFWFEKTDHILTPSESLYFTYRIDGDDVAALAGGVDFVVTDLEHRNVASGTVKEYVRQDALAVFRLLESARVGKLAAGWHNLAIRPAAGDAGGTGAAFNMKFFVRPGPFERRVVYLLDSVTPEGFAQWCHRNCGDLIEPLRAFPEEGVPDAVVVSSFTPLPEDTLKRLKDFVAGGGTAVFFGVNNVQLDELNPLALRRDNLYPGSPKSRADGTPGYLLNAGPASGATALRVAADGAPEVVEKAFGQGRVYAYAGALKPGTAADLVVSLGLGRETPSASGRRGFAVARPDAEGFREGISRGNFGRFGWLNDDRTHELSLRPEQTFRMWDVPQDYFGVSFSGAHEPGRLSARSANWVGKQLRAAGGRWGEGTDILWGLGTPGVLFRNAKARTVSVESPMLGRLAYPVAGGTKTVDLAAGKVPDFAGLSANWFLVWSRTDRYDAWPLLFTFNAKIAAARLVDKRLVLDFVRDGVDLSVMPLAGVRHFTPEQTAAWDAALPEDITARAARWSRVLGARAVGCVERYRLNPDAKTVTIRNDFDYLELANDWRIAPEPVAPVPPLLPIYAETGFVQLGDARDLDFATLHGPLWGVAGKRSEYTMALPDLDYPLPTEKVDPRLDLSANKALFERIGEHLAVPGLIYLGADHGVVERRKDRIYPERELREARGKHGPEAAEWKYIDLHRTLGGVTGNLMFKPYLDGVEGYGETRARMAAKINRNLVRDLEFFQYKTFLRLRQEPASGSEYLMAFMSPVRFNDGYWMFHDMNETIGIVLQTYGLFSRVADAEAALRSNEDYLDLFMGNYLVANDWAWMASNAVEWGMGNNIDMLNAELPGWAGFVRIKEVLGRPEEADFGRYMAAKAGVATGARLLFGKYYNTLNFPIPPELGPVIHEMAGVEQAGMRRNAYLPYGVSHGYGEGWPSLWPTSVSKGMVSHFLDGKDFYSSSKGVPPELLAHYRSSEVLAEPLRRFEAEYRNAAYGLKSVYLYSRIAGNAYLNRPVDRADLESMLFRAFGLPGGSAKVLGAGLADWEVSGMVIALELLRRSADEDTRAACVPVGDERGGKIAWEAAAGKNGEPSPKIRLVRADAEPEHVADGAVANAFAFPAPANGNVPALFTRFDRAAVAAKQCRALVFQVKTDGPGVIDLVLPNHDWTRRLSARIPLDGAAGTWQTVRLELERDLGMAAAGMKPEDLRGELFLYNGILPGGERPAVTVYLDDLRFGP